MSGRTPASPARDVLAGAPEWVTPELVAHTLRVWQPYYGKRLTEADALEMLLSTGALFSALSAASARAQQSERTRSDSH